MIQVHATLTLALAWEACHNDLHKEMKDLGTYVAERERLRLFTGAMGAGWVTLWVCAVTGWSGGQEATGRHVGVCGGQEATSRLLGFGCVQWPGGHRQACGCVRWPGNRNS